MMIVVSYFQVNMRILGQSFRGTAKCLGTERRLGRTSGNTSCFTEYRPICLQPIDIMDQLLLEFSNARFVVISRDL
jgi:hypothetical protein